MFTNLAGRLQATMRRLKGKGRLNEKDVDAAMREIRLALLEADVNFRVVKGFVATVRERALGREVLESLTPGQQVVKIVKEEMTSLLGQAQSEMVAPGAGPTVIMAVGLQGSGKTTTTAKLAAYFAHKGHRPLLVAADVYRPGAAAQLAILSDSIGLTCYSEDGAAPVDICIKGIDMARRENLDPVILDTAGRLHLDEEMMAELIAIKKSVQPHEVLLVVDAMTGQDAVNAARAFQEAVGLSGIILTKLDGDTRGGAALSVRAVTGCPVKFIGVGEKVDALEPFHPDRMASRILGMGDVLTLIEKAEAAVDQEKAREMEEKLRRRSFTLDDFREQLDQLNSMGSLDEILDMLPGGGAIPPEVRRLSLNEKQLKKTGAIIDSMTRKERADPSILNSGRRKRIARGSGTAIQDVNRLMNQFSQMQKMFKKMGTLDRKSMAGKMKKGARGLPFPF